MGNNDGKFEAYVYSQEDIAQLQNGGVGFNIPEYQRPYDWSDEDIERLFYDALRNFTRSDDKSVGVSAADHTFLGSVILVKHKSGANNFKGQVYEIVDGQQRLTTLALIACSLSSSLRNYRSTLTTKVAGNKKIYEWLDDETKTMIERLDMCCVGNVLVGRLNYLFPKILRPTKSISGDTRGNDDKASRYVTPIAFFFRKFIEYIEDNPSHEFPVPEFGSASSAATKIGENFRTILKLTKNINKSTWYEHRDFGQFSLHSISEMKNQQLFKRLDNHFNDRSTISSVLDKVQKNGGVEHMIRILLFSSYFHTRILLTQIETESESAAFDIFDSLNTTGQPITALETLKPRVVHFESNLAGFTNSESDLAYKKIAANIDEKHNVTSIKQDVTRDLVVSFAVYLNGTRLEKNLTLQRPFLTTAYESAANDAPETARRFVSEIASLSEFRYHYFDCANSHPQRARFNTATHLEMAKLLSSFISSMRTSMAIPLLFRYWKLQHDKIADENAFIEILKAVTAFIVLRRAATGGTDGIDSDFRVLMSPNQVPRLGLSKGNCVGPLLNYTALSTKELKSCLVKLLKDKINGFDETTWVKRVIQNPLYKKSRPLVRFMILIAAHNAIPSSKKDGTWVTDGVRSSSSSRRYFTHHTWVGDEYSTVEHIAPAAPMSIGWNNNLYADEDIRHKLGNLILLPEKENLEIGNQPWKQKRLFYEAATSTNNSQVEQYLDNARGRGVELPPKTEGILLDNGRQLEMLEPLNDLTTFDAKTVEVRSRNIAKLCWELLWPWLN